MAARMPTLADLGFNDPRVTTPLPQYSASDPGTAALGKLGTGLQQVGGAALRVAQRQEDDRQAMNDAMATTDFVNRLVPLRTKISLATDPAEIADLRQQYDGMLQTSATAIDDPQRKALWLSRHSTALLHAQGEADERVTLLGRQSYWANTERQLDGLVDTAKNSSDPLAFDVVKRAGQDLLDAAGKNGVSPQALYQTQRRFEHALDSAGSRARGDALAKYALGLGPAPLPGRAAAGDAGERVAATLRSRGWSDAAITGALNNSITESSLNPNATGGAGERGLFQFHPGSHIGPFTAAYGGDWSPEAQANYVADVVGKTMPDYARATDSGAATGQFLRGFERPKDQSDAELVRRSANESTSRSILTRASGDGNFVAFGDSIAAHLIRRAGVGGQESGKVGVFNEGDTAVAGWTPTQVLGAISSAPDAAITGKNIVLSTGASNDPSQLDSIPAQIDALRARGAASITLMGVGTADKLAGVNDKLAQIANANGATFAGPLRKVASDGIHSSDPKSEFAAARAAAVPENVVAQITETQPNRTGLPPLVDQYQRIYGAPGFSDAERDHAWNQARARYTAMEAEAARAERVAAQQRQQQDEQIEGEIIADSASPTPKWTAQGIMTDARLSPEARMRMLNFVSAVSRKTGDRDTNTYGAGFYDAFQAIHAPDGDPRKITSPDQLYGRVGPEGDLTVAGLEKLRGELLSRRTPEGEAAATMKKQFLDGAKKMISGADPLLHIRDPKGEELYLRFLAQTLPAYEEGLSKGKSPAMMLNPDSPDYLGKIIPQFVRPPEQRAADMLSDAAPTTPTSNNPADYKTHQDLIRAVQSGAVPYEAGVAEARRRRYIPPEPAAPIR